MYICTHTQLVYTQRCEYAHKGMYMCIYVYVYIRIRKYVATQFCIGCSVTDSNCDVLVYQLIIVITTKVKL